MLCMYVCVLLLQARVPPTAQSLGTLLNQAMQSNDKALIEYVVVVVVDVLLVCVIVRGVFSVYTL